MSKSRPVYAPFQLYPGGRAHLILTSAATAPEGLEEALGHIESWVVRHLGPGVPAPIEGRIRPFRSPTEMMAQLAHRLKREVVGLRLYVLGSEAFIWDAYNIAVGVGMHSSEISLHRVGPLRRRVYCTHCRTMIEDVTHSIVACPCCTASLFVRDHFSRRLAAFMGVKVDAEVPGEIPKAELFTS
jgi:predicted RNA-binding Zn-ribbon protein involved in translation (DUF1610 family)